MPVIVGVSAPGNAAIESLSNVAMENGASGVMIAPPISSRTDAQIVGYYRTAGERLGETPWVIRYFPLVTNVQIDPSVIQKIVEENPSCVMLKHEDRPGLEKIATLRRAFEKGARRQIAPR